MFPSLLTMTMDDISTQNYFLSAKKLGVTVNELLLRDCFLAVAALKKKAENTLKRLDPIYRPINLRTRADEGLSMANCVSMVFSEQRMADIRNPAGLLKTIHDDIVIKSHSMLKTTFLDAVDLVRYVPKLLAWITRAIPCFSTGVFSNTGIVLNSRLLPRKMETFLPPMWSFKALMLFRPSVPEHNLPFV